MPSNTTTTTADRRRIELEGIATAVDRSQAVIEFDTNGTILAANGAFLRLTGYSPEEIVGQHHRIFCAPEYADSDEYRLFWEKLGTGEYDAGEYKRLGKDGKEVWIQATYNPILDAGGTVLKVMKFASDVTAVKQQAIEVAGKMAAVDRAQAVIEFDLTGKVLAANENFLGLMGYSLPEVVGRHHRMFCDAEYVKSFEYLEFWERLGSGSYTTGEYKRVGKGGKEVWIQATYNPILDADGAVLKIVKFASDVTETKLRNAETSARVAAVDRAQGVIEFDLEGNIQTANANFLSLMGYTEAEVVGRHHRMFCEPEYTQSDAYRAFWEKLSAGEYDSGEYKRLGKDGKEVWIQATYNPILDLDGNPLKVIKFASDVTDTKLRTAEVRREDGRGRPRPGGDRVRPGRLRAVGQRQLSGDDGLLRARDRRAAPQHVLLRGVPPVGGVPRLLVAPEPRRAAVGTFLPHRQVWPRGVDPSVLQPDL